jgi:CTP synthase (UTP-ammonia lyase)
LVEVTKTIRLKPDTRLSRAYGREEIVEGYHCRYGIDPEFLSRITSSGLRIAAEDSLGDVRALELDEHPFFVATLFQPERAALREECPPVVSAFIEACSSKPYPCD